MPSPKNQQQAQLRRPADRHFVVPPPGSAHELSGLADHPGRAAGDDEHRGTPGAGRPRSSGAGEARADHRAPSRPARPRRQGRPQAAAQRTGAKRRSWTARAGYRAAAVVPLVPAMREALGPGHREPVYRSAAPTDPASTRPIDDPHQQEKVRHRALMDGRRARPGHPRRPPATRGTPRGCGWARRGACATPTPCGSRRRSRARGSS